MYGCDSRYKLQKWHYYASSLYVPSLAYNSILGFLLLRWWVYLIHVRIIHRFCCILVAIGRQTTLTLTCSRLFSCTKFGVNLPTDKSIANNTHSLICDALFLHTAIFLQASNAGSSSHTVLHERIEWFC